MASNHEDLEEFDSWEDMTNTEVMERKLKQIIPETKPIFENKYKEVPPVNMILLESNPLRSQYIQPKPTVKILKRPQKALHLTNGERKPQQQFKTLEQREQEYAEARLRILGEAHCSEKVDRVTSGPTKYSNQQHPIVTVPVRAPRGPDGTTGFTSKR